MISNDDIADIFVHRVRDGLWYEFRDNKPLIAVAFECLKEFVQLDIPCYPIDVVPMQNLIIFRRTDV